MISRVGDPLIYGDGPWFFSTAKVCEARTYDDEVVIGTGYKAVVTHVVVEDENVCTVTDAYWAGYGTAPIDV